MKKWMAVCLISLLAVGMFIVSGLASDKAPIKIGVIISLTDFAAEMGAEDQQAIEIAVEMKNQDGGILGHPVEVNIIDGRSDPVAFASAAERLAGTDILAAIGANDISFSQAAGAVFQDYGIVWVDCGGTTPEIPEVGDYNFMIPVPDSDQGRGVAAYVYKKLGYTKVAIFKDVASGYGTELTKYFIENFKEFTGDENCVPLVLTYQTNDVDYTSQLTRLKANADKLGIQAIILPTWPRDAPTIALQARSLGITLPLIGTDGVDTDALTEVGGDAVEGMIYSTHFHYENTSNPHVADFVSRFIAKNGVAPGAFGTMGFDAISVIMDAIQMDMTILGEETWESFSLSQQRTMLRNTLLVGTFYSATQTLKFNDKRQPQRGLTWVIVRDGERHFYDFQPYADYAQ